MKIDPALIVLAKAPVAGRSKTRLHPPLTMSQAAELAEACLVDTLKAVAETPSAGRYLVLDGEPGPWLPRGFHVVPQRGRGLDERLTSAFEDARTPSLLIGMDTPQINPQLLDDALAPLRAGRDAVLGPAPDGGYWAVGLKSPPGKAFMGVPMSAAITLDAQVQRFKSLGLNWALLSALRDVDVWADALEVAAVAPASRFAGALSCMAQLLEQPA